ncbi:hypothetical protein REC12_14885 [Desulfosporosinus sp. PR]|nr:hypothetical protein [Desulfosporosinus sp. PR]
MHHRRLKAVLDAYGNVNIVGIRWGHGGYRVSLSDIPAVAEFGDNSQLRHARHLRDPQAYLVRARGNGRRW